MSYFSQMATPNENSTDSLEITDHCDEVCWILDEGNKHPENSVDIREKTKRPSFSQKNSYLQKLTNAFLSWDFNKISDHLRTSRLVGYVSTELALFIKSHLQEEEKWERTLFLLQSIYCLISNEYALPADYSYILIEDALVFCLINPLTCNHDSLCFLMKDIAADILSELFVKDPSLNTWDIAFSKLETSLNDPNNSFIVHYGIIAASLSLGIKAIEKVVFPNLKDYHKNLLDKASRNVITKQSALKVWDKIMLVYEECNRYYFFSPFLKYWGSSLFYGHLDLSTFNSSGRTHNFFNVSNCTVPSEYPLTSIYSGSSQELDFVPDFSFSLTNFLLKRIVIQEGGVEHSICNKCKKNSSICAQNCHIEEVAAELETSTVEKMINDVQPEEVVTSLFHENNETSIFASEQIDDVYKDAKKYLVSSHVPIVPMPDLRSNFWKNFSLVN